MMDINMNDEDDGYVIVSKPTWPSSPSIEPRPRLLDTICRISDQIAEAFWPVNLRIHDHPELGYEEFIAHEALTTFMRSQQGWKVTPSAYGLKTAWIAVYDTGRKGAVVSFNAEMDALPGMGHACGHNLIASASVIGAVTAAKVMGEMEIPGKVVLLGTPAEEGGGGKIKLLERGAYSDHAVDISLISHPGIVADAARTSTTAYEQLKVEYHGRAAHAAVNPWLGINALDALISAYNSISLLRQQFMPGDIVQGHITDGGLKPNIIHAYASGSFVIRATTQSRLDELREKVYACFTAGATATGARLVVTCGGAYKDHIANEVLAQRYAPYFNALEPDFKILENADLDRARGVSPASSDQGDISHAMPSLSPWFYIHPGPKGQGPHNPEFADAARKKDAYNKAVRVGKGLAGVALDVLQSPDLLERVKRAWQESMKP